VAKLESHSNEGWYNMVCWVEICRVEGLSFSSPIAVGRESLPAIGV